MSWQSCCGLCAHTPAWTASDGAVSVTEQYIDHSNQLPDYPEPALYLIDSQYYENVPWGDARTVVFWISHERDTSRLIEFLRNVPLRREITHCVIKYSCVLSLSAFSARDYKDCVEHSFPNLNSFEIIGSVRAACSYENEEMPMHDFVPSWLTLSKLNFFRIDSLDCPKCILGEWPYMGCLKTLVISANFKSGCVFNCPMLEELLVWCKECTDM